MTFFCVLPVNALGGRGNLFGEPLFISQLIVLFICFLNLVVA